MNVKLLKLEKMNNLNLPFVILTNTLLNSENVLIFQEPFHLVFLQQISIGELIKAYQGLDLLQDLLSTKKNNFCTEYSSGLRLLSYFGC